jgi:hypothetical protein
MQTDFLGIILVFIAAVQVFTSTTKAETAPPIPLLELAGNRFGKLSQAEERLVEASANGKKADCTNLWGDDKSIRGELLSWLCTNPRAAAQLTYYGILIIGAEVVKEVDLSFAKVSFPIMALQCVFRDAIMLNRGHFLFVGLVGGSVSRVEATGSHFENTLILRGGFKAERE